MNQEEIKFLDDLTKIIEYHLSDENFGVDTLAREYGNSRSQLHRRLKKINGYSVGRYILNIRLSNSKKLLEERVLTVSEVAYQVGFTSTSYFCKCYKRYYGHTPSEARKDTTNTNGNGRTDSNSFFDSINFSFTAKAWKEVLWINFTNSNKRLLLFLYSLIPILLIVFSIFIINNIYTPTNKISEKSIAVLPFDDFSPNKDQEWLSQGLVDEINRSLAGVENLTVIARTTVTQYKESKRDLYEIAKDLRVSYFLQGSVMKYNDNYRINVSLISAKDLSQIWTKKYDQNMSRYFDIIDEVALNIARELSSEFIPKGIRRHAAENIDNMEIYEMYLQTRYNIQTRWGQQSELSRQALEQIIAADPSFVPPYSDLGFYWMFQNSWDAKPHGRLEENEQLVFNYLNSAIELNPDYADSYVYLGLAMLFFRQEIVEAKELLFKGYSINPSNFNKQVLANTILPAIGEFELALQLSRDALAESPLEMGIWNGLAINEFLVGNHFESRKIIENNIFNIDDGAYNTTPSIVYFALKEYQKVIELNETYLEHYSSKRPPRVLAYLAAAYFKMGQLDRFEILFSELHAQADFSPIGSPSFYISLIYAQIGQIDSAFQWLQKSIDDHEFELYWLKVESPFEPMRNDPRWQVVLDKIGFPK